MDACIGNSCGRFVTIERANEIETFFKEHNLPSNKRRISQLVENMKTNGAFLMKIKSSALIQPSTWV